jgi:hypothetical protein
MDDVGCERSGGLLAVSNRISRNLRSIFEIACRQRTIRKPFDLFVQVLLVERDAAVRLCVVRRSMCWIVLSIVRGDAVCPSTHLNTQLSIEQCMREQRKHTHTTSSPSPRLGRSSERSIKTHTTTSFGFFSNNDRIENATQTCCFKEKRQTLPSKRSHFVDSHFSGVCLVGVHLLDVKRCLPCGPSGTSTIPHTEVKDAS